jgi:hypothetical protein
MKKFDHFELDPNNHRILACGTDEHEQSHKTPIFRLSSIATDEHRVIVYDNEKPMYVLETVEKDEALKKLEELTAFVNRHFRFSPSCFMP